MKKFLITSLVFLVVSCAFEQKKKLNAVESKSELSGGLSTPVYDTKTFQVYEEKLKYVIPEGWEEVTRVEGNRIFLTIIPKRSSDAPNPDKNIMVSFSKKNPNRKGFDKLDNFVGFIIWQYARDFPNIGASKWQPKKLDKSKIHFRGIEIFSRKERDLPMPSRILYVESDNGFFTISATAKVRDDLNNSAFEEFFNSLTL